MYNLHSTVLLNEMTIITNYLQWFSGKKFTNSNHSLPAIHYVITIYPTSRPIQIWFIRFIVRARSFIDTAHHARQKKGNQGKSACLIKKQLETSICFSCLLNRIVIFIFNVFSSLKAFLMRLLIIVSGSYLNIVRMSKTRYL